MSTTRFRRLAEPDVIATAVLLGLGFVIGARLLDGRRRRRRTPVAIRHPSGAPRAGIPPVRPAGPEAMRDPPSDWTRTDEESDESFPARPCGRIDSPRLRRIPIYSSC